jgi:hypothetical protein
MKAELRTIQVSRRTRNALARKAKRLRQKIYKLADDAIMASLQSEPNK